MEKSLFFTLNISKYRDLILKILVLVFIFIANKSISQIYISDSSTITIAREAYISDNLQTIKAQIYITKETKIANVEAFSSSDIIYTPQKEKELKNSKQLFTSNKTKSSKKIDEKLQQPKENHLKSEFKKWDDKTAFLTINSILRNNFTITTQYQNTFFINDFTDKVSFLFFNDKRNNVYCEEAENIVRISIVFKTRPPPFYS